MQFLLSLSTMLTLLYFIILSNGSISCLPFISLISPSMYPHLHRNVLYSITHLIFSSQTRFLTVLLSALWIYKIHGLLSSFLHLLLTTFSNTFTFTLKFFLLHISIILSSISLSGDNIVSSLKRSSTDYSTAIVTSHTPDSHLQSGFYSLKRR